MKETLNIGILGYGGRGRGVTRGDWLQMDDINVTAVCDLYPDRVQQAIDDTKELKGNTPFGTTNYKEILTRDDVDCVVIYAAWEPHVEMAVAAMEAGKMCAIEVGGAYSVEDCWKLVDTWERTRVPFMFLENCCYDENELIVLNMVRAGVFGEIVHCRGAYKHDLRWEISHGDRHTYKENVEGILSQDDNRHYRLRNYIAHNWDNYPTHGLGPVSKVLDINNGNRMKSICSFASKSAGLHDYVLRNFPDDEKLCNQVFNQGDVVTSVVTCENGQTIVLTLDTSLPHSYSRDFTVQGTRASFSNGGVYLDNYTEQGEHSSIGVKEFRKDYGSVLWSDPEKLAQFGHGGMDRITLRAMVESFKNGTPAPIDVYDAVAWMSITCLSGESIRRGSKNIEIPDFTRGQWKKRLEKAEGIYSLDR